MPGEKLGIQVNGSNEVTLVRPGLAADAAGIRVGDVLQNLQKVDGTTISTRAELKEALKAADVPEEHNPRVARAKYAASGSGYRHAAAAAARSDEAASGGRRRRDAVTTAMRLPVVRRRSDSPLLRL